MIDQLIEKIKEDGESWVQFKDSFVEIEIPAKTFLLPQVKYTCCFANVNFICNFRFYTKFDL